jgi:hypothetical protein
LFREWSGQKSEGGPDQAGLCTRAQSMTRRCCLAKGHAEHRASVDRLKQHHKSRAFARWCEIRDISLEALQEDSNHKNTCKTLCARYASSEDRAGRRAWIIFTGQHDQLGWWSLVSFQSRAGPFIGPFVANHATGAAVVPVLRCHHSACGERPAPEGWSRRCRGITERFVGMVGPGVGASGQS